MNMSLNLNIWEQWVIIKEKKVKKDTYINKYAQTRRQATGD